MISYFTLPGKMHGPGKYGTLATSAIWSWQNGAMGTLLQKIPPGVGAPIQLVVLKQPRKCPELQSSYKTVSAVLQRHHVGSAMALTNGPGANGSGLRGMKSQQSFNVRQPTKGLIEGAHGMEDPKSIHRSLRDAAGDLGHDDMGQEIRDGAVFALEGKILKHQAKEARRQRALSADGVYDEENHRGSRGGSQSPAARFYDKTHRGRAAKPLSSPTDTHRSANSASSSKRYASEGGSASDRRGGKGGRSSGKKRKAQAPTLADFYKAAVEKKMHEDGSGSKRGSSMDSEDSSGVDSPIERMDDARRGSVDSVRSMQQRLATEEQREAELNQKKRSKKGRIRNVAAPAGHVKAEAEQDPDWSPPRAGFKDARKKLNDLGIYDARFKEDTQISQNQGRSSSMDLGRARRNSSAEAIPHGAAGQFRTRSEGLIDDVLEQQRGAQHSRKRTTRVPSLNSPVGRRDELQQPPPAGTKNDKLRPKRDKGHARSYSADPQTGEMIETTFSKHARRHGFEAIERAKTPDVGAFVDMGDLNDEVEIDNQIDASQDGAGGSSMPSKGVVGVMVGAGVGSMNKVRIHYTKL